MNFSTSSLKELQPCHHFEFLEIQQATNDFDESLEIGHGGFGKVYRGNIFNGSDHVVAAIKRLDSTSIQGGAEFWTEVEMLSKLRHCNLVSLIGYCDHQTELILVYEYMPNKTLNDHLHRLGTPLSWLQRLKICIGVARGLDYLHTGAGIDVGVIHRDVKSSNILLHESWAAKLSDFGLSRISPTNQLSSYVSTCVKGTFGYLDPEYFFTGKLTRKSDVYSFGVVLLEVLCRRPVVDLSLDEEECNLAAWAPKSIREGNLQQIIDSNIRDQISPICLKEFVRIVEKCLHNNPKERCTMAEVVFNLQSVLTLEDNINHPLHPIGETIFDTTADMPTFPSNRENSASSEDFYKESETSSSSFQGSQPCRQFEFPEIQQATNDFDESLVIGHGGFGKVYKGNVMNGSSLVIVAIKRLDSASSQGAAEFWAEVGILSRLRHCNLVSLIGYCNHGREMILIYEYMSNGTLEDHLHRHGGTPLSWLRRLKICIGAGRGLHYLHTGTGIEVGVTHRDVKTSNILLHESWAAKISDFGLSKTGPTDQPSTYVKTQVRGTFGYLDPDYSYTGRLTRKSDVYAFGVVLLEVLCGRPALDHSLDDEKQNLARWAQDSIKEGNLRHIIDSDIRGQISPKCLKEFVLIANRCLHNNPKKRPTMADVVGSLESVLSLQEKWNNSLETADRTILARMRDMFTFPSKGENSGNSSSY